MGLLLVVDDDANFVILLKDYFQERGYAVVTADNGKTGWQQYQKHNPQVIISGGCMPVEDGYQFLEKVRKDNLRQRFVMVSGQLTISKNRLKAISLGVDSWFPKPFEPEELLAQIRYYFQTDFSEIAK